MPSAFLNDSPAPRANLFTHEDLAQQRRFFASRPELAPTPLERCRALARDLGVGELLVKNETARFGLNAFKATGAFFAVSTLIERGDLRAGDTVVCASEGNHGRAVARAARQAGCTAHVYMSRTVASSRVRAIESEGAKVVLVDGSYDEAVRVMADDAAGNGWTVISDTSWAGYTEIPRLIALGYTRIMDEVDAALVERRSAGAPPAADRSPVDVIFVPAGVGGLLSAVACWCDLRYGTSAPKVVAVEPLTAACVQTSVRVGQPTSVPGPFNTAMGGLRCGEMSPDVFPAVASLVHGFISIEDEFAFDAMRRLARPSAGDPAVECGASGAASLGGLLALLYAPGIDGVRKGLPLTADSRVLVIATEGVTDPDLFEEVMARGRHEPSHLRTPRR